MAAKCLGGCHAEPQHVYHHANVSGLCEGPKNEAVCSETAIAKWPLEFFVLCDRTDRWGQTQLRCLGVLESTISSPGCYGTHAAVPRNVVKRRQTKPWHVKLNAHKQEAIQTCQVLLLLWLRPSLSALDLRWTWPSVIEHSPVFSLRGTAKWHSRAVSTRESTIQF